jgi:15-cis-phytoene synthase
MNDWVSQETLLTEGYRHCAKLTWNYGTTYFWGAALLPRPQRKHVYAVYALCRLADDIVDLPNEQQISSLGPSQLRAGSVGRLESGASTSSARSFDESAASTRSARILDGCGASTGSAHIHTEPDSTLPEPDPIEPADDRDAAVSARFKEFADQFRSSLDAGGSTDPVMAAVINTVTTCGIDSECFERFFNAMAMDLTTTSYQTWEDLRDYMEGSAAVIGEMMLPVLQPINMAAKSPARSLGLAFQLTNFLRDVAEDLDRGRVYMPQDDLRLFDVDLESRAPTQQWRAFMSYEIERNRALYSFADTGIAMLPPRSARCVGTARVLYSQILDQIERRGHDVFSARARVPTWRKAATAARIMVTGPRTLKRQAEAYQRRSMANVTQDTY